MRDKKSIFLGRSLASVLTVSLLLGIALTGFFASSGTSMQEVEWHRISKIERPLPWNWVHFVNDEYYPNEELSIRYRYVGGDIEDIYIHRRGAPRP